MTRKELMLQLYIEDESDIILKTPTLIEKLFCAALLTQDTKIIVEVLKAYNNFLSILEVK